MKTYSFSIIFLALISGGCSPLALMHDFPPPFNAKEPTEWGYAMMADSHIITLMIYDEQMIGNIFETGISGQVATWINPSSGNQFQMIPWSATFMEGSVPCRKATLTINGHNTILSACRDHMGQWNWK